MGIEWLWLVGGYWLLGMSFNVFFFVTEVNITTLTTHMVMVYDGYGFRYYLHMDIVSILPPYMRYFIGGQI